MKITFGFFVSKPIERFMKRIEPELEPYCSITYIPVIDQNDIAMNYRKFKGQVDAFIFSGRLFYYLLLEKIKSPSKPCFYLDENNTDIKEVFLKLLLEDRNFDFSKTFIDMAGEFNQYLGIKDLLKDDQVPYFNDIDYEDAVSYERKIVAKHIELHRSGLVDLSITRLGNCLDELDDNGIKYVYAFPPLEYTINFFMKAINQITLSKTKNQIMGTIVIQLADGIEAPSGYSKRLQMGRYSKLLSDYAQKHGYDFTLQEKQYSVEILTFYRDIVKITDDFSSCSMKSMLEDKTGDKIIIGFGTGHNIYRANLNAREAAKISMQKQDGPYYYSYEEQVIGPLAENPQDFNAAPSKELLAMAKKLHIDHVNLQKIIAFTVVTNTTKVSSDALAEYLNISLRSASRLLTKIHENDGALAYFQNIDGKPGRPKKLFDLTFINDLSKSS